MQRGSFYCLKCHFLIVKTKGSKTPILCCDAYKELEEELGQAGAGLAVLMDTVHLFTFGCMLEFC